MFRARTLVNAIAGPNGQKLSAWFLKQSVTPAISATGIRTYNVPASQEPFLNGSSSTYVEDMYNAWLADPSSVHAVSLLLHLPKKSVTKQYLYLYNKCIFCLMGGAPALN